MDTRNVQRTGNMFYVYLPTSWCKKHNIDSDTKVSLDYGDRDSLILLPKTSTKKRRNLTLSIKEDNHEVLQKLITAAYISPADSFKIELEKKTDVFDLLSQKKFITFEPIELDENVINCESSVALASPISLLNTMVTKIKNLIIILKKTSDGDLVSKYEDEIDKIKVLIEKSVISSLTHHTDLTLKATDLYYASNVAKSLEHLTDYLRFLKKKDHAFLDKVSIVIDSLKEILATLDTLDYKKALAFARKAVSLPSVEVKNLETYEKQRILRNLIHISEALLDWSLVKEVEKTK